MTTDKKLTKAMLDILSYAKSQRDMSVHPERARWSRVASVAHAALGKPSVAELQKLSDYAESQ